MSRPLRSIIWQGVVLFGITGIFYWVGHWNGSRQAIRVTLPTTVSNQIYHATATPVSPFPAIAVAEARNRFAEAQADKLAGRGNAMAEAMLSITFGINNADIPALIKALSDLPDSKDKSGLMQSLLFKLEKDNPVLALALAYNVHDEGMRSVVELGIYQQLANTDPAQTLRALAQMEPGYMQQAAFKRIFQALGSTMNPVDVEADVNELAAGTQRDSALQGLVLGWSKVDPKAALDFASSLQQGNPALLKSTISAVIGQQPALAAQYVSQIQDDATRNATIESIGSVWGAGPNKDPAAALDWLNQEATGDVYSQAVNNVFTGLAKQDHATAASMLNKITDPATQQEAITTVAANWSKNDPDAALAWVQTLPPADSTAQASALNSIITTWSNADPAAAAAYVQSSSDPSAFLSVDAGLAKSLAVSNPQTALAFAQGLPAGDVQNQALNNVLTTEAQTNFNDAWNSAASLPAGNGQNAIMTNLVSVEAGKDPAQAAALLSQFPDEATQLAATNTLSATWVKQDPEAFGNWINTLSPGDMRDAAIQQLVSSTQSVKNPDGVLQWVNTVSNPQTKAALLKQLGQAQAAKAP